MAGVVSPGSSSTSANALGSDPGRPRPGVTDSLFREGRRSDRRTCTVGFAGPRRLTGPVHVAILRTPHESAALRMAVASAAGTFADFDRHPESRTLVWRAKDG